MQKLIEIYNKLQDKYFIEYYKNINKLGIIENNTKYGNYVQPSIYDLLINPKYNSLETLQKDDGFNEGFKEWQKKKYSCIKFYDFIMSQMLVGYLIEYILEQIK